MENAKENGEQTVDPVMKRAIEAARKMLGDHQTLAMTQGITPTELEAAYKLGQTYYVSGQYDEAEKIFKFLVLMNHLNAKFHLALGAVRQVRKEYRSAMESYGLAALCNVGNPKPHFYAAECAYALGDLDTAESGVLSLLAMCPAGNPTNDEFRGKAENLKNLIKSARAAKK